MKYYIGIDGGGTKTSAAVGTETGEILAIKQYSGCSYQEIGTEAVVRLLTEAVKELLAAVGAEKEECGGCCIGIPCFGENRKRDEVISEELSGELEGIPLYLVNDSIVGWAGSLNCQAGIHLVAGTGSIAVGCDSEGNFARCGGWSETFGDEGSCYWVGRKVMQIFSREADGRLARSPIYKKVREHFGLENDFDVVEIVLRDIFPYRDKVAALQKLALQAAEEGDETMISLYGQAAQELSLLIKGVKEQLGWGGEKVRVSYFGGLFHAEKYVLPVFQRELEQMGCILCRPMYTATEGALRLAVRKFREDRNG